MRWALVAHPAQFIRGKLVQTPRHIPEDSVPVARAQGWIVIGTDTEVLEQPLVDVPAQSNPHRLKHGYGHVEGEDGA